jgi:hypothetical protein
MSLRGRLDRLEARPGSLGADECRCHHDDVAVGSRITADEYLARSSDPDEEVVQIIHARCAVCGGRSSIRVHITEVIVETREDAERLRAAGAI